MMEDKRICGVKSWCMVRSKKELVGFSSRTKLGGWRCGGELGNNGEGGASNESHRR